MRRERFANNASTTLSASAASGDTTLSIADGSVFPSLGDFRLLVEAELMLCTARSGNTLTVQRAIEGTTATGHPSGAAVTHILTASSMQQYGRDNVPGFDGSRPPYRLVDASGTFLTSADFTQVNAASHATITDADGSIALLTTPAASAYAICLARAIPGTPTLVAALRPILQTGTTAGFMHCFVGFRESATGKLVVWGPHNQNGALTMVARRYDSPTSISSTPFNQAIWLPGQDAIWLKLNNDGSNLIFSVGDGVNWIDAYSEGAASFFTTAPDQFVFGTNAAGVLNIINRLVAWQEG